MKQPSTRDVYKRQAQGRLEEARAAAEEALDVAGASGPHRAQAADRLAELAGQQGDITAAVAARRRAWTSQPTRPRLLAMAATSIDAGVLTETLAAEADAVSSAGGVAVDRLGCELLLLAGRIDAAVAALTPSAPLGWHNAHHPGQVWLLYTSRRGKETSPGAGGAQPGAKQTHEPLPVEAVADAGLHLGGGGFEAAVVVHEHSCRWVAMVSLAGLLVLSLIHI